MISNVEQRPETRRSGTMSAIRRAFTTAVRGGVFLSFVLLLAGETPETVDAFLVRERRKAALRLPVTAPDLLYKYAWELLAEKDPEKAA